jgi:L-aminopeptidase/D-esterase-like protein
VGNCRRRPDKAMGYAACQAATGQPQGDGSVGAGVGATVGKLLGVQQATKGGLGTSFLEGPQGLHVGALAVVNAFGDVVDPGTGTILAGARRDRDSHEFVNTVAMLRQGFVRERFGEPNTTIAVVATNARLTREQAQKVAQMGHNALARCIRPVHTLFDGDTVFVLASPEVCVDLHLVGVMAEAALEQAILGAVKAAGGLGVLPAYQDIYPGGAG